MRGPVVAAAGDSWSGAECITRTDAPGYSTEAFPTRTLSLLSRGTRNPLRRTPMPVEITMPQLSDTMTDGMLVKWLKKEGEKVKAGEIVAEVETDKATMEME